MLVKSNCVADLWVHRLPKSVIESPLVYTKTRDLHYAGIVLLQMLLGKDVMDHYPDFHTALATGKPDTL